MLYILSISALGNFPHYTVKIQGIFESATDAAQAAHNLADGFSVRWDEEELEQNEILCLSHGGKRIRVMGVEPNTLWPLAYCP